MDTWYQLESEEALTHLGSDAAQGLSADEAARRLEQHGPNELEERGVKTPWQILWEQFTETMVVILIIATVVSALLGEFKDAAVVLAVVVLNALLGFRQEYQAEKAMAALKKMAVPVVKVRRGGHVREISSRELVPGDIVLLEAGNLVPADCRLLESANLRTQEAALTGESEPVSKSVAAQPGKSLPLAERHNMVYMGTVVSYGRGEAVVAETGMRTELGKIADLMQSAAQEPTPLQVRLDRLGKQIAWVALGLVVLVFVLGLLRGEDLRILFLTGIGLAVAAVPEGLPAVVTIGLALGARRMLRRKALIRKLPAVEALGSVTVICSDKTGTLTENRMTVTVIDLAEHRIDLTEEDTLRYFGGGWGPCEAETPNEEQSQKLREYPALALMLAGGVLCNDALLECDEDAPERYHIVGDPTEGALMIAAAQLGMTRETLEAAMPRLAEIPFESERKRMTTFHSFKGEHLEGWQKTLLDLLDLKPEAQHLIAFTKGAMDGLLEIADRVWVENKVEPLDAGWRQRIESANENLAKQGMRVLGVACRALDDLPEGKIREEEELFKLEQELIFIGLVGMIDPARAEVKEAVRTCKTAGIRPMMITGDHPLTARYIASELDIDPGDGVLTGGELDSLSEEEIEETVERVSVYARVSPEHKLKIVRALQNRGQIAAMTGDGVNDAPALRQADIGVAMGIAGTDVSKEAADMVLLDDNFATIVAAVEEGRVIYDNIRKFIKYTFTSNAGEIWVMLLGPFLGMPLALLPLQILWINLVTDGLPGLALGVEKAERNTMRRPPYPPNENIFARGIGRDILFIGFLMGVLSLGIGYWYWRMDQPIWQTMVFTTLTLSEMGYVLAIRSNRDSLFRIGVFSNRALIGAVILTTLLQVAVVYVPFLQNIFETMSLPLRDLGIAALLSTSLFFVVELQKWIIRRNAPE
jgi:Ca2+-transporting ATPase